VSLVGATLKKLLETNHLRPCVVIRPSNLQQSGLSMSSSNRAAAMETPFLFSSPDTSQFNL
jgi:hypothetical protein